MKTKDQVVAEVIKDGTTKEELAEIHRIIRQFESIIKRDVTATEITEIDKVSAVTTASSTQRSKKLSMLTAVKPGLNPCAATGTGNCRLSTETGDGDSFI